MADLNPRAVRGDNTDAIDFAKEELSRLQRDYAALAGTAEALELEEQAIPEEIPDDATKDTVVDLIKRIRDARVRIEALHGDEKQPHFRRGQGVDQFFFGLWDRLQKRDKKNRDGAADRLGSKLTRYDTRKLAEENERRRIAAEEATRIAAAAQKKEREAALAAEELRLAAERARKPETTAAKEEVAKAAETVASSATVEAVVAEQAAEDARIQTFARPADIMRNRTAGGSLSTMAVEKFAEVENVALLDAAVLFPYIAFAEKEKALRAWAKSTGYTTQMTGAKIGERPKSVVR